MKLTKRILNRWVVLWVLIVIVAFFALKACGQDGIEVVPNDPTPTPVAPRPTEVGPTPPLDPTFIPVPPTPAEVVPTPTPPSLGLAGAAEETPTPTSATPTVVPSTPVPPTLVSMSGGVIAQSQTRSFNITASTFPKGMAGYSIRVSTADPTIAIPILFTSPDYGLTDIEATSTPGSIRLAVVDLNSLVEAGASNVVLGTVTFEGLAEGNTAIVVTVEKMDDEGGFPILTSVSTGLLTVTHSQDLDGDGLTEDRNANGFFDFADIIMWFEDLLEA